MTDQLQLRHWQQIKQAMALEYAGTPEGNAALIESRRYGLAADRIDELIAECGRGQRNAAASQRESATLLDKCDELAAQVEAMRDALENAKQWHQGDNWRNDPDEANRDAWQIQMNRIDEAIALPNTADAILRQRDARTLREAAEVCSGLFEGQVGIAHVVSVRCAVSLNEKADKLERKNG